MTFPRITDMVDPPGPNAQALLDHSRKQPSPRPTCAHQFGGAGVCVLCGTSAYRQPSPRPTVARVLDIVRNVIRARRQACYGELRIGDDQLEELARAIVTNIAAEIATGDL